MAYDRSPMSCLLEQVKGRREMFRLDLGQTGGA